MKLGEITWDHLNTEPTSYTNDQTYGDFFEFTYAPNPSPIRQGLNQLKQLITGEEQPPISPLEHETYSLFKSDAIPLDKRGYDVRSGSETYDLPTLGENKLIPGRLTPIGHDSLDAQVQEHLTPSLNEENHKIPEQRIIGANHWTPKEGDNDLYTLEKGVVFEPTIRANSARLGASEQYLKDVTEEALGTWPKSSTYRPAPQQELTPSSPKPQFSYQPA